MSGLYRYQLIRPGSDAPRRLLVTLLKGEHDDIQRLKIKNILVEEEIQLRVIF